MKSEVTVAGTVYVSCPGISCRDCAAFIGGAGFPLDGALCEALCEASGDSDDCGYKVKETRT